MKLRFQINLNSNTGEGLYKRVALGPYKDIYVSIRPNIHQLGSLMTAYKTTYSEKFVECEICNFYERGRLRK